MSDLMLNSVGVQNVEEPYVLTENEAELVAQEIMRSMTME